MSETAHQVMQSIEDLLSELEGCNEEISSLNSRKLSIELTLSNISERFDALRANDPMMKRQRKPRSDKGVSRKFSEQLTSEDFMGDGH